MRAELCAYLVRIQRQTMLTSGYVCISVGRSVCERLPTVPVSLIVLSILAFSFA